MGVRFGLRDAIQEKLDPFVCTHGGEHAAHRPNHLQRRLVEEELLSTRAGALHIDRREDPLLRKLPVEAEL